MFAVAISTVHHPHLCSQPPHHMGISGKMCSPCSFKPVTGGSSGGGGVQYQSVVKVQGGGPQCALGGHSASTRQALGRHSASTRQALGRHSADTRQEALGGYSVGTRRALGGISGVLLHRICNQHAPWSVGRLWSSLDTHMD